MFYYEISYFEPFNLVTFILIHTCEPSFINNLNMTANSVEKHWFVVLNVIELQVKISLKTFC